MSPRRPIGRRGLALGIAALALALLALALWLRPGEAGRPALWEIEKGDRRAYLFGTIHAVPADAEWLSPAIEKAADRADYLILEVTGLAAERKSRAVFDRLGKSPGLPPVAARLSPADGAHFRALAGRTPALAHGLDGYESWAAALLIGASVDMGQRLSTSQAGEARFTQMFEEAGKPIGSLETIRGQLGLFDRMPEALQRVLLSQSVREADAAERIYGLLYARWSRGDVKGMERLFASALGGDPRLRAILIDRRNARWAAQIDALLMRHRAVPLIAVGAGHLLGPGNVGERLKAMGWKVKRVQ